MARRGFTVDVQGMDKLRKRLKKLADETNDGALAALEESGEAVQNGMERRVPVDRGDLLASIETRVHKAGLTGTVGPRGADTYYAVFQEFGTQSVAAQPFAGPAAEEERGRFPDRLRHHVGKAYKG